MADWVSLMYGAPKPADVVGDFSNAQKEAIENSKNAYSLYQTRKLQEIMSDKSMYNPDGSVDYNKVQDAGQTAGIGKTALDEMYNQQSQKWKSAAGVVGDKATLDAYGVQLPDSYQTQQGTVPGVPPAPPVDAVTAKATGTWSNPAQTILGENAPTQVIGGQDTTNLGTDVPSPKHWLDEYFPLEKKQPSWFQNVDTAKPAIGANVGVYGEGGTPGISDFIDYNVIRDRNPGIDRYLESQGIALPGQQGIDALMEKVKASVPVPQLNPMARLAGKEEYAKEVGRYRQAQVEYPAKVQEVYNKVRQDLWGSAGEIQSRDIAKEGNVRAQNTFEQNKAASDALMGQGTTFRYTSPEEQKALTTLYIPTKQALTQAMTDGTPESAMRAAVESAKIDGGGAASLDGVINKMAQWGVIPSNNITKLKLMMGTELNAPMVALGGDVLKKVLGSMKELDMAPRGISNDNDQAKNNLHTLNDMIKNHGGITEDKVEPLKSPKKLPLKPGKVSKTNPLGLDGF